MSLKLSFSILLLVITIFVAALGILFFQSRQLIKKEAMERATNVLNTTAGRVDGFLRVVETATHSNDWLVTENLHPDSLLAYSHRIVLFNAYTSGCSITTEPYTFPEYGRYFSAYSVPKGDSVVTMREGEYEYFEKVWYKTPRELGRPCWVDPFDDFNEGTLSATGLIASYCKPLYGADGRFIGVISTDLSLSRLSETIQADKPYPNAYFFLLGKDGRYFVHPDTARLFNRTIFTDTDVRHHQDIIALGHEMTTGKQGSLRIGIGGRPCLVCYRPIAGTQWSLALVCPDSDILHSYYKLSYIILPLILFGLLVILLLCRRIVAHAVRPLNQLVELSQRIASGQFDEQIPHTNQQDAVGRLQNSFATMQVSINRHVGDIEQANVATAQRNEELRQASLQAEEAGRQKTAFIQNMTHQIRTPLNIIMGFAQVLRDSRQDLPVEEIKDIADMMNHNAMTLNRLVLMLYDSSETGLSEELQSRRNEDVSCNDVARESIAHTHLHFPELPISFETSLPDTFCIRTNRLYLMRSLREILYNSAKYSDGQHVTLRIMKTEKLVRFIFEDTGPGMAENYRQLMFVPFTKVNDLSEGLGLGLPLAKRHVGNLGGNLLLDPDYHDGCRFIIELPLG